MREGEEVRRRRFDQLFRETRADLLAFLVRRAESLEDAADALAETYLIVWRKLDAVPSGRRARPWLFGVARNVLLKGMTRRRSHRELVERLAGELRVVAAVGSERTDPRSDMVRAALARLPDLDREILTLRAWEALSPTEIGVVLGRSANYVRVRLHRARVRLRRELDEGPPRTSMAVAIAAPPRRSS
jgi:RNA polymerase sigma-70 factor (ECF subfamily)